MLAGIKLKKKPLVAMVYTKYFNVVRVKGLQYVADSDVISPVVDTLENNDFWIKITQTLRSKQEGLAQCWANVVDDGPTLYRHWLNDSCLLGDNVYNSPKRHFSPRVRNWITIIIFARKSHLQDIEPRLQKGIAL